MNVIYHRHVHKDVGRAQRRYDRVSVRLGDEFWGELMTVIEKGPQRIHFATVFIRNLSGGPI